MVAVNVAAFEIEVRTRHGDVVRADVYLPKGGAYRSPSTAELARFMTCTTIPSMTSLSEGRPGREKSVCLQ
jgi:hypothetical protein